MSRLTNLLCTLVSLAVFLGLTSPVLAGPTPTPTPLGCTLVGETCGNNADCCSNVCSVGQPKMCEAAPTPTPTPAPTPEPTPGVACTDAWDVITIFTDGKTERPVRNAIVRHAVTGNIVNPGKLSDTAHQIHVCQHSFVRSVIGTLGQFPASNTAQGSLDCTSDPNVCEGVVSVKEQYKSVNFAGSDRESSGS